MDYGRLAAAVDDLPGEGAPGAVRITTVYEPDTGPGTPVAPSTVERGRPILRESPDGHGPTVVVDSFGSSANRIEQALLDHHITAGREPPLPVVRLGYDDRNGLHRHLTSWEWPHRSGDAYFWQSLLDGTPVGKTDLGRAVAAAAPRAALPIYRHFPHALIFGAWHSFVATSKSRRTFRQQRCYAAETVATDVTRAPSAGGRQDPLFSEGVQFRLEDGLIADIAEEGAKDTKEYRKSSEVGLGMLPPQMTEHRVQVQGSIVRRASLSFAALRGLRFADPFDDVGPEAERDVAGRAVLAALALYGDRLFQQQPSVSLRSGCTLMPVEQDVEVLSRGDVDPVDLSVGDAHALLVEAVAAAEAVGLFWHDEPVDLTPSDGLRAAIHKALPDYNALYGD